MAPEEREVPAALFEEEAYRIPPGSWGNATELSVWRRTLDADGDGAPERIHYLDAETRALIRIEEDRNYDGRIDAWRSFESGELVLQALDETGDGKPDQWEHYAAGRMTSRALDRSGNGKPDVELRYDAHYLSRELHDTKGDGNTDRWVFFSEGRRSRAEADRAGDGSVDTWITYSAAEAGGREYIAEMAFDTRGVGTPNLFERYELGEDGNPRIVERGEDLDFDGNVDVRSFYQRGKLVRREIRNLPQRPQS